MAYQQRNNPFEVTSCGRRRTFMNDNSIINSPGKDRTERSPFLKSKEKGIDGKACWKGYKLQGTKMKGGKKVDNCVKI